jgi:hypothetical protein
MDSRVLTLEEVAGGADDHLRDVYISGPMRGYPKYNFPAFDAAEVALRNLGFTVISPAALDRAAGFNEKTDTFEDRDLDMAIDRDVQAIRQLPLDRGAVAVLPGWEHSTGARAEVALAIWRGLPIIVMPGAEPLTPPAPPPVGLPTDAADRKAVPLATGMLDYFPNALAEVARVSRAGNEQHHPGQPLHWDKTKSTDEADALLRHLVDRGKRDKDGMRHTAKVAWRALALLQRELDEERK